MNNIFFYYFIFVVISIVAAIINHQIENVLISFIIAIFLVTYIIIKIKKIKIVPTWIISFISVNPLKELKKFFSASENKFYYLLTYYTQKNRKLRLLKKIAADEFKNARGTAHLNMLYQLANKLEGKLRSMKFDINTTSNNLLEIETLRITEMRKVLEKSIVHNYLGSIPGIGQSFIAQLESNVFKSNLSDLRRSYMLVRGIGNARQTEINKWITTWENKIPQLLIGDFPGKHDIAHKYESKIKSLNENISDLKNKIEIIEKRFSKVQELRKQLASVTVNDFIKAIVSDENDIKIQNYMNGLFPEWEPVPKWFKDLFSE